ncbi:MAG: rhodanese-like domain-containing protein [Alphaproteobacteria bacterium]|nr:rhodanese-like domain-containing protein [Alphaproteobacteria bacterium]
MAKTVEELVKAARAEVPAISPAEAKRLYGSEGAVFLDVREPVEVAVGKVKGAVAIPRGVLEFQVGSAENRPDALSEDKTVVVYCAGGGRAALAGQTLKTMGFKDVRNLGGYKDWVEADGETERDI